PLGPQGFVKNLRPDGGRLFFQSTEALVLSDRDGQQDVYEWEESGVGSCKTPGGCVYLISSGESSKANYLYAASDSGDDVFFRTSDLLLPIDPDQTASIYDARVGGGFAPSPAPAGCSGNSGGSCQVPITAPEQVTPASAVFAGGGNVKPAGKHCPRGKRKVHRGKKVRCVSRHRHRHHKKNAPTARRSGR
ncbi:MAG TPA: hypothetical protein VNC15_00605, partial [Solirubrobacterales bacterium]|nr:hypothetical protein [Solirubrobacterales bacterium]